MTEKEFDKEQELMRLFHSEKWDENQETGCWEWKTLDKHGYGQLKTRLSGRYVGASASRVSLRKKLGRKIRSGYLACHTCDNRSCVNPDHLYEGTAKDNTADMMRRERHNDSFIKGGLATRKLSMDDARNIRSRAAKGEGYTTLMRDFGVSRQTISNVVTGALYGFGVDARGSNAEQWKHRAARSLTEQQVHLIVLQSRNGVKQKDIEDEFELASGTVTRIMKGRIYRDVTGIKEVPPKDRSH